MNEELKEQLSKLPTWVMKMTIDYSINGESITELSKRYKKTRNTVYRYLQMEEVKDVIKDLRIEAIEHIPEILNNLKLKSLDLYNDVLNNSNDERNKINVAKDVLRGTQVLSDKTETNGNIIVEIAKELVRDND